MNSDQDTLAQPEKPATAGAPARRKEYTVRAQAMAAINNAAIEVFAREGLSGATTQAIAERAGISKQQLHYYIESKDALYRQILQDVMEDWIKVFGFSDEAFGPRKVLSDYIRRKLMFSFEQPLRSQIFAMELMRGGAALAPVLESSKRRAAQAHSVIRNWIDQGLMSPVDPQLLMFDIWALTEFYANQATQVSYLTERAQWEGREREAVIEHTIDFVLRGAGVK